MNWTNVDTIHNEYILAVDHTMLKVRWKNGVVIKTGH